MTFDEILARVLDLLQRQGRVSYRALKRRFDLDDDYLEDLKAEIITAQQLARDEAGEVLVWTGGAERQRVIRAPTSDRRFLRSGPPHALVYDLVDSASRSSSIPKTGVRWRAYQHTCGAVVQGDGAPVAGRRPAGLFWLAASARRRCPAGGVYRFGHAGGDATIEPAVGAGEASPSRHPGGYPHGPRSRRGDGWCRTAGTAGVGRGTQHRRPSPGPGGVGYSAAQ